MKPGKRSLREFLDELAAEERRHLRRLKMIRYQGYFMQALIIAVFLFFTLAPFFL